MTVQDAERLLKSTTLSRGGPRTPVFILHNGFQEGALKPEISDLQRQVQKNCDISDARHAGVYSLCGLLLRMRDLYKWEHR
ncbi:MAG: hypothetical protein ABSG91_13580, partial [Syntrophobacteraceae bacterium]